MVGKTKKATFSLHTDVLAELDRVMAQGKAASKNALVEQALIKELQRIAASDQKKSLAGSCKGPVISERYRGS